MVRGRVENGVVVLPGDVVLPEGAEVFVSYPAAPRLRSQDSESGTSDAPSQRVRLPLVPSKRPGTCRLTAERVAELLDEDGLSS